MDTTADHYIAPHWPPDPGAAHPTTAEMALGEHACHLAAERDAALTTATRERAESRRLRELLRQAGERVAMQGQTIRALRGQLAVASTGAVGERIEDALPEPRPSAPAPAAAVSRTDAPPSRGRLIPWVRR